MGTGQEEVLVGSQPLHRLLSTDWLFTSEMSCFYSGFVILNCFETMFFREASRARVIILPL